MSDINTLITGAHQDRYETERLGFDSCLAILCCMGMADIARRVVESAEVRTPGFISQRQRMRRRLNFDKYPGVYLEEREQ